MINMPLFKRKNKKYDVGMKKSREGIFSRLASMFVGEVDEDFFTDLEEVLIMGDLPVTTVLKFVENLRKDANIRGIKDRNTLKPIMVEGLKNLYLSGDEIKPEVRSNNSPTVVLFVGVNGVGKTTTIAKYASKLLNQKNSVLLAAADTFRAGAIEQLSIWADRLGVPISKKADGSDPSSVIFDALKKAKDEGIDYLLCDTAGRLQNKVNLMKELEKIKRVIEREIPGAPHETFLVIDATTGQNGMEQARVFIEATDVSGVVLTKLDGTAKGGIVLAIKDQFNIPIRYVGLGEKLDDLEEFDIELFLSGLLSDLND